MYLWLYIQSLFDVSVLVGRVIQIIKINKQGYLFVVHKGKSVTRIIHRRMNGCQRTEKHIEGFFFLVGRDVLRGRGFEGFKHPPSPRISEVLTKSNRIVN